MSLLKTIITTKLKYILQKELSTLFPDTQYVLINESFEQDTNFKGNYGGNSYTESLTSLKTVYPLGQEKDYAILNPVGLSPIVATWSLGDWVMDIENVLTNMHVDNVSHKIILKLNGSLLSADYDLSISTNVLNELDSDSNEVYITTWVGTYSEFRLIIEHNPKTLYFVQDRNGLVFLGKNIVFGGTKEELLYITGQSPYQLFTIRKDTLALVGTGLVFNNEYSNVQLSIGAEVVFGIYGGTLKPVYKHNLAMKIPLTVSTNGSIDRVLADDNNIFISYVKDTKYMVSKLAYSLTIEKTFKIDDVALGKYIRDIQIDKDFLYIMAVMPGSVTVGYHQQLFKLDKNSFQVIAESEVFAYGGQYASFHVNKDHVYIAEMPDGNSTGVTIQRLNKETFQREINSYTLNSSHPNIFYEKDGILYITFNGSLFRLNLPNLTMAGSNISLGASVNQIYIEDNYIYVCQGTPSKVVRKFELLSGTLVGTSANLFSGASTGVVSSKYKEDLSWLY